MSGTLEKNMVIEGPLWPEPVRVLSVDHFGTMLQVDAVGTRTRQFYPGIIVTGAQVEALKVLSSAKGMDFSGDAEAFHLAVESMRIRLAYEYDPHFAVNASTITPLPHQLDAVYRYMLKSPLVRFPPRGRPWAPARPSWRACSSRSCASVGSPSACSSSSRRSSPGSGRRN
jgi:hypothetical protein